MLCEYTSVLVRQHSTAEAADLVEWNHSSQNSSGQANLGPDPRRTLAKTIVVCVRTFPPCQITSLLLLGKILPSGVDTVRVLQYGSCLGLDVHMGLSAVGSAGSTSFCRIDMQDATCHDEILQYFSRSFANSLGKTTTSPGVPWQHVHFVAWAPGQY